MDAGLVFRAVLKSIALPPIGPLVAIVGGFCLRGRWRSIAGSLIIGGCATLLLLSLPVVADALALWVERTPPNLVSAATPRAIVVLSGGIRTNAGSAGYFEGADVRPVTLTRLAAGARLSRQTGLPLLVSGGRVEDGPTEAAVMAAVLDKAFGIQARFREERSRNTHENAIESAAVLRDAGIGSVYLVTSALHIPRAVDEFRSAGLSVSPYPVAGPQSVPKGVYAWLPHPWALEESHAALYEVFGRALKGAIGHD